MGYALHKADLDRIHRVLVDLLAASESDECLLCDAGGYVIAQEGPSQADAALVSALSAGVFSASRELARTLGEDTFSHVLHQGRHRSIFIQSVSQDLLLVVVFSHAAGPGLIKLYAGPAAGECRSIFADIESRPAASSHPDGRPEFILNEGDLFAKPG